MQSPTVRSLTLDKLKQLVDVNGDLTNFRASVEVSPKSEGVYEVAIVNQTILDNAEDFKYSVQTDVFRHMFEVTDGIYQNYFVCLKAASPIDVDVKISVEKLPSQTVENVPSRSLPNPIAGVKIDPSPENEEKFYHQTWFKWAVIAAVVLSLYLGYRYYSSRKTNSAPPMTHTPKLKFNFEENLEDVFGKIAVPNLPVTMNNSPPAPVTTPAPAPAPVTAPVSEVVAPSPVITPEATVAEIPSISVAEFSDPKKVNTDFASKLLLKLKNSSRM